MKRNSVILIPALNPDKELIQYIQELKRNGFDDIIVVTLIEQIIVYSKEQIEIQFKYSDEMQEMMEAVQSIGIFLNERSRWTVKCCSMRLISEKEEP